MTLRFGCPNCKANYDVADDLAGKMIMCRVCKKRGKVQSLPAQTTSSATVQQAAASASSSSLSRRDFLPLASLVLASIGAVATGALLARQPWDRSTETDRGPGRFRKGPPPEDDKKDGKGGKGGTA